jgi:phosphoribosylamine-glycine ligase
MPFPVLNIAHREGTNFGAHTCKQVVLAARGYPGSYQKGSVIRGLEHVSTAKVLQPRHSTQRVF